MLNLSENRLKVTTDGFSPTETVMKVNSCILITLFTVYYTYDECFLNIAFRVERFAVVRQAFLSLSCVIVVGTVCHQPITHFGRISNKYNFSLISFVFSWLNLYILVNAWICNKQGVFYPVRYNVAICQYTFLYLQNVGIKKTCIVLNSCGTLLRRKLVDIFSCLQTYT